MTTIETQLKRTKRQLILHDSLAFLILLAVTAVLFAATLFLFRSFSAHRAAIARQAGEDGRLALAQGRPHDAIADLRTALSYAPTQRDYELLLAQALGEDGRLEEAINYFLNLWESQPGDGFINLQLARLERQRNQLSGKESPAAINYYRASIFGSWNGDGVVHRRDVRLELANYLIDQKQFAPAQTELLIASSNAPPIPGFRIGLGDLLLRSNDPADALKEYQKAILDNPADALAYEKAGRLAYTMGDYPHARDWLEAALRKSASAPGRASSSDADTPALLAAADRLISLKPALAPNRTARISRTLAARAIASRRFDVCSKQLTSTGPQPLSMQTLAARWTTASKNSTRAALTRDDSNDDLLRSLVDDTETTTARLCGPPQGDDALLLLLAQHPTNP